METAAVNSCPLVSVVMATFNEPVRYITESIESILNQTYTNLELLICDDSTNQDTIATIDKFAEADPRVRIIRKPTRMGFVPALNEGLRAARGEFIARMDGDDISLPDRFEKELAFLITNPEIAIVGGGMNIIDAEGQMTSNRSYPSGGIQLKRWAMMRNPLGHPTVMFRKFILKSEVGYDETQKMAEDLEFWLRLMRKGYRLANLSETVLNYRVLGDQAQKRKAQWTYNAKARRKNFTLKMPIFSIGSVAASTIYTLLPQFVIRKIYSKENNQ